MTTIAGMRSELADVFKTELPSGWDIQSHMSPKTISKPTLMIGSSKVRRGSTHALRVKEVTVMVVTPKSSPGLADDHLDELLDVVLDVLDRTAGTIWSEAERVLYAASEGSDGTNPAYTITLTMED